MFRSNVKSVSCSSKVCIHNDLNVRMLRYKKIHLNKLIKYIYSLNAMAFDKSVNYRLTALIRLASLYVWRVLKLRIISNEYRWMHLSLTSSYGWDETPETIACQFGKLCNSTHGCIFIIVHNFVSIWPAENLYLARVTLLSATAPHYDYVSVFSV